MRYLFFIWIILTSFTFAICPTGCVDSAALKTSVKTIKTTFDTQDKLLAKAWVSFKDSQKEVSKIQGDINILLHNTIKLKAIDNLTQEEEKIIVDGQNKIYYLQGEE